MLIEIPEDKTVALDNLRTIRKALSSSVSPPIKYVVSTGVVDRFLHYVGAAFDAEAPIQLEASWCLTNIVSGDSDDCSACVQAGAIGSLCRVLSTTTFVDVKEQVLWAIGNIAGDSVDLRDQLLAADILPSVLEILDPRRPLNNGEGGEALPVSMRRTTAWVLSNLCRGKPRPPYSIVSPVLPVLSALLDAAKMEPATHGDAEMLGDVCWALSYLSETPAGNTETDEHIRWFRNGGVRWFNDVADSGSTAAGTEQTNLLPRLVELLQLSVAPTTSTSNVLSPVLRTVGNLLTGGEGETSAVLEFDVLPALVAVLRSSGKKKIQKEVCWAISNITAGSKEQVATAIDSGAVGAVMEFVTSSRIATGDERKAATEALWVLSNAVDGAFNSRDHNPRLLPLLATQQQGLLGQALVRLLEVAECAEHAAMAMEALEKLLDVNNTAAGSQVARTIMAAGGIVGSNRMTRVSDSHSLLQLQMLQRFPSEGPSERKLHSCVERILAHRSTRAASCSPSKLGLNPDADVASDSEDEDIPTLPKMRAAKRLGEDAVIAATLRLAKKWQQQDTEGSLRAPLDAQALVSNSLKPVATLPSRMMTRGTPIKSIAAVVPETPSAVVVATTTTAAPAPVTAVCC